MIVTSNVRDFPPEAREPYDVDIQTPDEFLSYQWEIEDPDYLLEVLEIWVSVLSTPPLTLEELLGKLANSAPSFSETVLDFSRRRASQ